MTVHIDLPFDAAYFPQAAVFGCFGQWQLAPPPDDPADYHSQREANPRFAIGMQSLVEANCLCQAVKQS
ncbi:MAG: hypothetical protein FWG10_12015 [Eubacteriaceae bacterium]|nr:hypothetical protein [Eubacteriaceae bacterium]